MIPQYKNISIMPPPRNHQKSSLELAGNSFTTLTKLALTTSTFSNAPSRNKILLLCNFTFIWALLIATSRKGDAHKVEALAIKILGAKNFDFMRLEMLKEVGIKDEAGQERAKNGFVPEGFAERLVKGQQGGVRNLAVLRLAILCDQLEGLWLAGYGMLVVRIGEGVVEIPA